MADDRNELDVVAQEAWRSSLTADIARLQRQLDALQDALVQHAASAGRQMAGHHERLRVQEMAAERDPDHAKRIAAAKVEREQQLIPVTQKPAPKPVIKINDEKQARDFLAAARGRREKLADDHPDAVVIDRNIAKIEAAFPALKLIPGSSPGTAEAEVKPEPEPTEKLEPAKPAPKTDAKTPVPAKAGKPAATEPPKRRSWF